MRQILFFAICTAFCGQAESQDMTTKETAWRNSAYGELGGIARYGTSLNYERSLARKGVVSFNIRAGVGWYVAKLGLFGHEAESSFLFPLGVSVLAGQRHGVEFGGGVAFGNGEASEYHAGPVDWFALHAGYRLQLRSRFMMRLVYSPTLMYKKVCRSGDCSNSYWGTQMLDSFGLSMGVTF
jgi:hypothetical protein